VGLTDTQFHFPVQYETIENGHEHWAMVVINFPDKRVEFWEPLYGGRQESERDAANILSSFWRYLLWEQASQNGNWKLDQWDTHYIVPLAKTRSRQIDLPQQASGMIRQESASDCGPAIILAAAFRSRGLNPKMAAKVACVSREVIWLAILAHKRAIIKPPQVPRAPHRGVSDQEGERVEEAFGTAGHQWGTLGKLASAQLTEMLAQATGSKSAIKVAEYLGWVNPNVSEHEPEQKEWGIQACRWNNTIPCRLRDICPQVKADIWALESATPDAPPKTTTAIRTNNGTATEVELWEDGLVTRRWRLNPGVKLKGNRRKG
jgi:hypothetical protein